jgi:hypothetical protein
MGVTLDQINQGFLDVGKIVTDSMTAWNTISGKTPLAQTTVATPQPAGPAAPSPGTLSQSPPAGNLMFGLPTWALLAGGALVVYLATRRH